MFYIPTNLSNKVLQICQNKINSLFHSPGCAASGSHGSPALVVPRGADPRRLHAALDQDLGRTKLKSPKARREQIEISGDI